MCVRIETAVFQALAAAVYVCMKFMKCDAVDCVVFWNSDGEGRS